MFLLRSVKPQDLNDLFQLSQLQSFINLPSCKDKIEKKIHRSMDSFECRHSKLWENRYIFVLEDTFKKKVIGCSMISAQHGTEDSPHFFLSVGKVKKYAHSIKTEVIHETLKLGISTNGPSEIGGLILSPEYRSNPLKLGKQLSYIRFLFMGLYPERFKDTVHVELMPPRNKDGTYPLWEAFGRRFIKMNYEKADDLSLHNKEFILNLYPKETIYQTLLPDEAKAAIGKVNEATLPVKHMLEKIGFEYIKHVDPFDGGPHYRAILKEIKPIKSLFYGSLESGQSENKKPILIRLPGKEFSAVQVEADVNGDIVVDEKKLRELNLEKGMKVHIILI